MSNPLDLTTLQRVKLWLNINTTVGTTIAASIAPGLVTVTPASMANITPNTLLSIDVGILQEIVSVIAISPTTFTALFALAHTGPGIAVSLAVDALLPELITSAGMDWLTMTGRIPGDGSVPTVSPLVQLCSFNEWYDGSGSVRQFVRNPPVASIIAVQVNGVSLPQSTGFSVPGYVVGEYGACVAIRQGGYANPPFRAIARGIGWQGAFTSGIQNVNLQYMGGFVATPFDIVQACTEMIGLTFRKRQWIGQKSQLMAQGGGSVTYQDWAIEPNVRRVINNYMRKAIV